MVASKSDSEVRILLDVHIPAGLVDDDVQPIHLLQTDGRMHLFRGNGNYCMRILRSFVIVRRGISPGRFQSLQIPLSMTLDVITSTWDKLLQAAQAACLSGVATACICCTTQTF
jgi:hypothetical protein